MKQIFLDLVKRNSGTSSTRWAHVVVCIIVVIILLSVSFVMIFESIKHNEIKLDYFTGLAAIIGACSTLLTATGITKVMTDKYSKELK